MAATSLSSSPPRFAAKLGVPKSSSCTQLRFRSRRAFQKLPSELLQLSLPARSKHARTICPAADNNQAAPTAAQETSAALGSNAAEGTPVTPSNGQPQQPAAAANANGSAPSSEPPKRAPLTARERLRAARVLGKYAEPSAKGASSKASGGGAAASSRPAKPEFGSGVLDALREADAKKADADGGRRRSRLPEAPGNLFDDSMRRLPKDGWTFELPLLGKERQRKQNGRVTVGEDVYGCCGHQGFLHPRRCGALLFRRRPSHFRYSNQSRAEGAPEKAASAQAPYCRLAHRDIDSWNSLHGTYMIHRTR